MKPEVNERAVENFLASLDKSIDVYLHYANARMDAKVFKWNMPTLNAILKGICKAYSNK